MEKVESNFSSRVNYLVSNIPRGRVMTYGQIAALCGNAAASRVVGGLAHYGDPEMPWQRVVNKAGGLASGYPGGREAHRLALEEDGIKLNNVSDEWFVDMAEYVWYPKA